MSGRAEGQNAEISTFVGIFAFPLGVMTSARKEKESSRVSRVSDFGYPDHPSP
jgi:hypothetical protein